MLLNHTISLTFFILSIMGIILIKAISVALLDLFSLLWN